MKFSAMFLKAWVGFISGFFSRSATRKYWSPFFN